MEPFIHSSKCVSFSSNDRVCSGMGWGRVASIPALKLPVPSLSAFWDKETLLVQGGRGEILGSYIASAFSLKGPNISLAS